eukprot:COSAG05_NODE_3661_length_1921_cov_1.767289_1_plen_95_part_00
MTDDYLVRYRYEPPLQRAREMAAGGELGRLTSIYVMYNIHHPEAVCARYPGVIRQIMTHHAYSALCACTHTASCTLYTVYVLDLARDCPCDMSS